MDSVKKRDIIPDLMKAIGIILVIIGHSTSNGRYLIYTFHMPLFFLVSGYYFQHKTELGNIIKKGIKRLIVPYIITCLCVCLFHVIKSTIQNESVLSTLLLWIKASLIGLPSDSIKVPNVSGVQHIGAIWFFEALFWARIELWLILKCKKIIYQFILLICIVGLITLVSKHLLWIPTNIGPGTAGGVFLWIGHIIRKEALLPKYEKKYWIYLSLLLIIVFSVVDRLIGKRLALATLSFPLYGLDIIGAVAGCYLVYKFAQYVNYRYSGCTKALSAIGSSSAEVLCTHLWDLNCLGGIIPGGILRLGFRLVFDICGGVIINKACRKHKKSISSKQR